MGTEGTKAKQKRFGGLQGKARHNRFRNRAWRLHSQQLIEEFVDPEKKQKNNARQIPIKHRSEFVPSAPVMGSEYGVGTERELELVYSTGADGLDTHSDVGLFDEAYAIVPPDTADESAITFSTSDRAKRNQHDDAGVKPTGRTALFADEAETVEDARRTIEQFTARGFAFGCALGTAAAAVLLMMVRVALL